MYKANTKYEVMTPNGWQKFSGVLTKEPRVVFRIELINGITVSATENHIFYVNDVPTALRDLRVGEALDTGDGPVEIVTVEQEAAEPVYDLVEVENSQHVFYITGNVKTKNCDEMAFLHPNMAKDFWTAIRPTLSTGGSCIITSTPKNDEDQFAQIWKGAIDNVDSYGNPSTDGVGSNGFAPTKVIWDEHPDRDQAWADAEMAGLGEAKFRQEHCCEFLSDDDTLISPLTLTRLHAAKPVFFVGTMRWYADPEPNRQYLVALDPSMGTKRDSAAIQVFQLPELVQIAEWSHNEQAARNQMRVLMQTLLYLDGTLRDHPDQYGDPDIYWTVENNALGEANLQIIEDTGEDRFPGQLVSEKRRRGIGRARFRKGMTTTTRSKLSACARLKSLIESDRMVINSANLIKELKNFVSTENSFKAKPGEHDDLVTSTLLIVRMLDVVLANGGGAEGDLREYIDDEELSGMGDGMPVL